MGYTDVAIFEGGIEAWKSAGGEIFTDVNVPSKAFGELMESRCHTPSLAADQILALLNSDEDVVVVDVRRFDEYQTMCIPSAVNVPGGELVLRVPDIVASPETTVIVNCAGRTRGLLGTQSLINAGLPNKVFALRNGTIGWTLAGHTLDAGQTRRFDETRAWSRIKAAERALAVARKAAVKRTTLSELNTWVAQSDRTIYRFDVRGLDEYEVGHIPGFFHIPSGQLTQETEMYAPVRGARIVLVDDDGCRANMCASWLAQMAWDVYVLDGAQLIDFSEHGPWRWQTPPVPKVAVTSVGNLVDWRADGEGLTILDLATHAQYRRGHIPGASYLVRSRHVEDAENIPRSSRYVLTSDDGELAQFAAPELQARLAGEVYVLSGGTDAWVRAGFTLESGETSLISPPVDRYRRPYEGTDISTEVMQAYLDWEFGLVDQLGRDGTHYFEPMCS